MSGQLSASVASQSRKVLHVSRPCSRRIKGVVSRHCSCSQSCKHAIGKLIQFFGEGVPVEVVGVARNANYQSIGEAPQALIYLSLVQYYSPTGVLYVRTAGDPNRVLPNPTLGHVTSWCFSPNLDRSIALALLSGGRARHGEALWAVSPLADAKVQVSVGPPCFIDPDGERLRV